MTPFADAFLLCPSPECDAWLRHKVERSVELLLDAMPPDTLEAIILTGSTARGEASILPTSQGFQLLGDLEFLVIVRMPFDWRQLRQQMTTLSHRATQGIGAAGREAVIEYGPAGRVYLQRNIRPSIFAYDLYTHGKVVWGPPDTLMDITPFEVGDIPPEDALNLLMNRLTELLLDIRDLAAQCIDIDAPLVNSYHAVKLPLDLAGSVLACTGGHVSRYRERGGRFAQLLQTEPTLAHALSNIELFNQQLDAAMACKLEPSWQRLAALQQTISLSQCARWGRELWQWQIQRLLGGAPSTFRDALDTYVRRESLATRSKGWIKFFRHPMRPQGALSWSRLVRLAPCASPQTLTYATALLLLAGLTDAGGPDWEQQAWALAPVQPSAPSPPELVSAIGKLWTWLIRNN